jgi:hypothetical protein
MRVRRLLHETTSRLELAALQKADAVVDRLTFSPGPRPARTPDASMSLDPADTIELTETLDFTVGWLASDSARLTASLLDYVGHPAYGPQQLRQDLDRFAFLRGGSDGEELFGSGQQ